MSSHDDWLATLLAAKCDSTMQGESAINVPCMEGRAMG